MEKYLEQSLNAIRSLHRWKLPNFSAVLNSALPQGLSAAPRNAVTQGEVQGKLAYTGGNAKHFLVKQNMSFLMSTQGFRVRMDMKGHLTDQHTCSARG